VKTRILKGYLRKTTLPTERRPIGVETLLFMNNTTQTNEPTTGTLGQRRLESSRNLLGLIDSAIRAVEPKTDWLKTAPTTTAFCLELDKGAKQPGTPSKLPREVFTQFDPTADTYQGGSLQLEYGRLLHCTPDTAKALLAAGARLVEDATLITDEEKTLLLEIQAKMDSLKTELSKYSNQAANAEFHNQSQRHVAETLKSGALPAKPIRLMDSIHAEFSTNRRALSEVLFDLYQQTFPLAIKAHAKAVEIIRAQMAFLENEEREKATAFTLPWAPSFLWKACAAVQIRIHPDRLRNAAREPSTATPREMLAGIYDL
jgi:hypothetical protein